MEELDVSFFLKKYIGIGNYGIQGQKYKNSKRGVFMEMRIYELQEYAKENGYNSGKFVCVCEKGFFEFRWLDAYFGLILMIQPKAEGFLSVKQMIDLFGCDQKYFPTIGYDSTIDKADE